MKQNVNLTQFKNSQRCYIIGLGPSLNDIDLTKIDGDTIVTNRFYLHPKSQQISPNYHVIIDNHFFTKDIDELESNLPHNEKTAHIFNGQYFKQIKNKISVNNIFYILSWGSLFTSNKTCKVTKITPAFNNVVLAAIYLALSLNYKEIILLGCDFNSFCSQKKLHSYIDSDSTRIWSLKSELFQYSFSASTHEEFRKFADSHNIRIMNNSKGSLIDAYEFINMPNIDCQK